MDQQDFNNKKVKEKKTKKDHQLNFGYNYRYINLSQN